MPKVSLMIRTRMQTTITYTKCPTKDLSTPSIALLNIFWVFEIECLTVQVLVNCQFAVGVHEVGFEFVVIPNAKNDVASIYILVILKQKDGTCRCLWSVSMRINGFYLTEGGICKGSL